MQDKGLFSDVKYLTVNDKDPGWGLITTTAGYQSILPDQEYPPRGHPSQYFFRPAAGRTLHEYQLIYITRGEGRFKSANIGSARLEAGMLIMLFPGEWHTYQPVLDKGWDTYWVGFRGSFPDNLIEHHFFSKKSPVYDLGFNERIVELFKEIIEISKQEKTGFQQMIGGITMHLLGVIYYIIRNNLFQDKDIVSQIERARMIMWENPGGEMCPDDIASSLNMSYSWFRRMFKQYTGLSPAQYQLQVKLQKAKALLIGSSKTVKEIAFILDFESANYFTFFFKQKTGTTPIEFRKIRHGNATL